MNRSGFVDNDEESAAVLKEDGLGRQEDVSEDGSLARTSAAHSESHPQQRCGTYRQRILCGVHSKSGVICRLGRALAFTEYPPDPRRRCLIVVSD